MPRVERREALAAEILISLLALPHTLQKLHHAERKFPAEVEIVIALGAPRKAVNMLLGEFARPLDPLPLSLKLFWVCSQVCRWLSHPAHPLTAIESSVWQCVAAVEPQVMSSLEMSEAWVPALAEAASAALWLACFALVTRNRDPARFPRMALLARICRDLKQLLRDATWHLQTLPALIGIGRATSHSHAGEPLPHAHHV